MGRGLVAGCAADVGGRSAGAGDGAGGVAAGKRRAGAVAESCGADAAEVALVRRRRRYIAGCIAVRDGGAVCHIAGDAARMLLTRHVDLAEALGYGGAVIHVARDAAGLGVALCGAGHVAGDAELGDRRAAPEVAEQSERIGGSVDIKVIDNVAVAVEGCVEVLYRSPLEAGKLDICGELRSGLSVAFGIPCKLGGSADEVHAGAVLLRLGLGLAVPRVCADGGHFCKRDGQNAILNVCRIGRAEGEAAAGAGIAALRQLIGVGAVAKLVAAVSVRLCRAARPCEGDADALERLAVSVNNSQRGVVKHLAADGNDSVRIVVHGVVDGDCVEVCAHAGVRHAVNVGKRVGGGVHAAVGVAVREGDLGCVAAVLKRDVLGYGDGDVGIVHSLILSERAIELRVCQPIGRLEVGRVEDAGDFVHCAEHAAEGELDLVARHDGLLGVGDVLGRYGDLAHADKTVGNAGVVGHFDDDGAALAVAAGSEARKRYGVASVRTRSRGGEGADAGCHVVSRGDKRILDRNAAGRIDGEVKSRVLLVRAVEPCVVVVIPLHRAGRGGACLHVEVNVRVRGAVGNSGAADHDDAGALRLRRGEESAVGAIVARIDFNVVVVNGYDGVLRAGSDIGPVFGGVSAADGLYCRVADGDIPMEIRLYHNVSGVGVDNLPMAVGAHARRTVKHLEAAGIEVNLKVCLVAHGGLGAQPAEIVGGADRRRVSRVGKGHFLVRVRAGEPACLRSMGGAAHAVGVVSVRL